MAVVGPDIQPFIDAITKLSDADRVALSEAIMKEHVLGSSITRYHDIQTGVKCNTPIVYMDKGKNWEVMGSKTALADQCDFNEADINITTSTKTWNPQDFNSEIKYCAKDLACAVRDYFNSETCSVADDTATAYGTMLREILGQALVNSHWVRAYFSSTAEANPALNGIDGLFAQYLAIAPPSNTAQRIVIAENSGATYADQALPEGKGYEVFNAMYEKFEENEFLRNRRDVTIKTTRALALNYLKQLRKDKQLNCCERDTTTSIYSIDSLNIYGMPIEVVNEWDEIIANVSEFNDGTRKVSPHRAVLTYKANEPIATCDASELSSVEALYDPITRNTHFRMEDTFDIKVVKDDEFIIAI